MCHSPHPIQVEAAAAARAAITARLESLLGADGAILLPSTPTTAPKLGMMLAEIDPLWQRIICLVAPAAEAGLPQVRGCSGFPGACRRGWPATGAELPRVSKGLPWRLACHGGWPATGAGLPGVSGKLCMRGS